MDEEHNEIVTELLSLGNLIPSVDNLKSGLEKLSTQTSTVLTKILPELSEHDRGLLDRLQPIFDQLKSIKDVSFEKFVKEDLSILAEDTSSPVSILKNLTKTSFGKQLTVDKLLADFAGVDPQTLETLRTAKFNLAKLAEGIK